MSIIQKKIIDGKPTYFYGPISFTGALQIMDRSTGAVRFYVKTRVNKHEFHAVSENRHNIYTLGAGGCEKLEIIIRLIDRYRSQRKMEQNDRDAEKRYHQAVSARMERKRRENE